MNEILSVIFATGMGMMCRICFLKIDKRMCPSYPKSFFSHLVVGLIAALLGAVFVPALFSENYTAVTFLTLAASQFREVRTLERDSLLSLEENENVKRGEGYIEDIAKKFEARNYACMLTSLLSYTALSLFRFVGGYAYAVGFFSGVCTIYALKRLLRNAIVSDIALCEAVVFGFSDAILQIEGEIIGNIALKGSRKFWAEHAFAYKITAKEDKGKMILSNYAQQQAILHTVYMYAGLSADKSDRDLFPLIQYVKEDGSVLIASVCMDMNREIMRDGILNTPILDSARRG